LAGVWLRAS